MFGRVAGGSGEETRVKKAFEWVEGQRRAGVRLSVVVVAKGTVTKAN